MTVDPTQSHLHINYKDLCEKLEEMKKIERDKESAIVYHRLLNSLPKLISSIDLIEYHNFLIKNFMYSEENVKEFKEEIEELEAKVNKYEDIEKSYRDIFDKSQSLIRENESYRKALKNYKSKMIEELRTKCSPEAFSEIERILERL